MRFFRKPRERFILGKWHIKLAQLELRQLRWVNCGKPKLGHLNLKQITTFGEKIKVPFTNLIYYNTTKHESHTKQKRKIMMMPTPTRKKKWNRKWTQNPNGDGDGDRSNGGGRWVTELRYFILLGWRLGGIYTSTTLFSSSFLGWKLLRTIIIHDQKKS